MLFYIMFQVLKVLLIKICKIEPADLLFVVVFISFYISRYHFSQILRNSFRIIRKKDLRHGFSFLTDSLNQPCNFQNKSVNSPFNWVPRNILFLPKLKPFFPLQWSGKEGLFWKSARRGTHCKIITWLI